MTSTNTTLFLDALMLGKVKGSTFKKVDLSRMDFSGRTSLWDEAILPEVNLVHTDMRSTLLLNAVMHGAILRHTDVGVKPDSSLSVSDWNGTDLSGATVVNSTLTNGVFNRTKWVNATFDTVAMSGAYFNYADFRGAKFIGDILFRDIVFAGADLRDADLSRVVVPSWTAFDGVHGISFDRAIMNGSTKMPRGFNPRNHRIQWA
ncbi:pentapeptide repeat-containing protein [Patescibacteria group bacterium]|nr:pentapeptide repeat-containing protein [Patescibacteria group bacterium]